MKARFVSGSATLAKPYTVDELRDSMLTNFQIDRLQGSRRSFIAFYDGHFGGASNCGFGTYEQCLATISGVGGWCQPNTMYVPPPARHRRYRAYPYRSGELLKRVVLVCFGSICA
jgi:uncharacterized protein DUF3551